MLVNRLILCTVLTLGLGWAPADRVYAAVPPGVTNGTPAEGTRVRVTGEGYAGTNVYHTVYLPTDWQPDKLYPVIVEYAPNQSGAFAGTVEDTQLGYYQSGGEGYIWVTMPFIDYTTNPGGNATSWWGSGSQSDPAGEILSAQYTKTNLPRVLEDYGGDPSAVFATGFSRGAIATSYIGLRDDEIADIWLGLLPHSHHDAGWFGSDTDLSDRLDRTQGRATFITYGELDSGAANSFVGKAALDARGFPVEQHELAGVGHTDEWITDASTAIASLTDPTVTDVRERMRAWIEEVIDSRPGTSGVSGVVTDALGNPIEGVRVQSGGTHWAFTDENGEYELLSLLPGDRSLVATHVEYTFTDQSIGLGVAGLSGQNFVSLPEPGSLAMLSLGWVMLACRRRRT